MGAWVKAYAEIDVKGRQNVVRALQIAMKLEARYGRAVGMGGNAQRAHLSLAIDTHDSIHGEGETCDALTALGKLADSPFVATTDEGASWYGKPAAIKRERLNRALMDAGDLMRSMRLKPEQRGALAAQFLR